MNIVIYLCNYLIIIMYMDDQFVYNCDINKKVKYIFNVKIFQIKCVFSIIKMSFYQYR